MEFSPEGPKAIPLWINGHAFLTVSESFFEVVNPLTGQALRRVPLCGADEAMAAVTAARDAAPGWAVHALCRIAQGRAGWRDARQRRATLRLDERLDRMLAFTGTAE